MPERKYGIQGINNIAIVDRTTKELAMPILKVIETVNKDFAETVIQLKGGASNFAYAAAIVDANSSMTFALKEFPATVQAFLNHSTATERDAEAAGNISEPSNVTGTSIVSATTGITTSVTATADATLKEGVYLIKAPSTTTLNFYGYSDFDNLVMDNDASGLVNATPYAVTSGEGTDISELGITITGGSGVVAFTEGDTAILTIRKINSASYTTSITDTNNNKYYEAFCFYPPNTEQDLVFRKYYKVQVSKGAYTANMRDWHSKEITLTPVKDADNSNNIGEINGTIG